ncbi:MAG: putative toxin-antitoxin system toxin component, PIN family [Candidatus Woesebacteria bacterium]|nr:putative toxin-antitoxin system toxin component, PIN family [Candidatus Woesebacteria bacterium]
MPTPPQLIFIDTNVWFSAFYGSPNSEKLIKAHTEGKIKAVVSRQVLRELVTNINKKMPNAMAGLKKIMESAPPVVVNNADLISSLVEKGVHKKDQAIFQSAINSKSKLFVTGNIKHFNVKSLFGIKIVTPKEAVGLI